MSSTHPIYMFNALWFKTDGGAARYQEYLRAATAVAEKLKVRVVAHPKLVTTEELIGEWDPDVFFVVEYDSREEFNRFTQSNEFRAIAPIRESAIERSLLIQCQRP